MKKVIKGINFIVLALITLTFFGCEDDDVVLPNSEALFTQTINQDSGTVTFLNASSNADSFAWDFGDGTTSTEINPIKVYTTGTYTVVLTAANVADGFRYV